MSGEDSMSSDDTDFNPDALEALSAKEEYDSEPSSTSSDSDGEVDYNFTIFCVKFVKLQCHDFSVKFVKFYFHDFSIKFVKFYFHNLLCKIRQITYHDFSGKFV